MGVSKFIDTLEDKYLDRVLIKHDVDELKVVPTGSLALDVSTGIGGIPFGRFTEIYGPEGSGKTTLCLTVVREAIKQNPDVKILYLDAENSLDYTYIYSIIGEHNRDNILFVQTKTAEDTFSVALLAVENNFDMIFIDSLAALSPSKEIDGKMEKENIAIIPREVGKFLRISSFDIVKKNIAVVITNQVRANIGSFVGGLNSTGGFALKHFTALRIFVVPTGKIEDDGEQIGNFVKFTIKKNKLAPPHRSATTNIIYGKGIDYYMDVIAFGKLLGFVKTRGGYFYFGDEKLGLGMANSVQALKDNTELLDKLVESCYNIVSNINILSETEEE